MYLISFISERELTFTFAICYRRSVCLSVCLSVVRRLSVLSVTLVRPTQKVEILAIFFAVWYLGHPLTSTENFTEIVPGEPLRRGGGVKRKRNSEI